ncbi:MAG: hypothetical protein JWN76_501 [Chitinophagaceae bacterium]|nr:hypothetical protein [Chitinophagaceae bacterium]
MKLFFTMMMTACALCSNAQAIELRGGQTLFPSDYLSLTYEHYTNRFLNLAGRALFEKSSKRNLQYAAYGADLLVQTSLNDEQEFSARAAFGVSVQTELEPWIYKNWKASTRLNYGVLAELSGNWIMTETFSLNLFVQQKLLFNKALGLTRFAFGLGLRYQFPHY